MRDDLYPAMEENDCDSGFTDVGTDQEERIGGSSSVLRRERLAGRGRNRGIKGMHTYSWSNLMEAT